MSGVLIAVIKQRNVPTNKWLNGSPKYIPVGLTGASLRPTPVKLTYSSARITFIQQNK